MPAEDKTRFAQLNLHPALAESLRQLDYAEMTPIQALALPLALAGKDLIAQAETGSGKTAAFALALLERLNPRRFAIQALVLCPTRELADQVATEIRRLARALDNTKVVTLCGGVALRTQRLSLEKGAHIAVGTPGRVLDHLRRSALDLQALNAVVLDEADRMLDMGFFEDIATVLRQCPRERQTLLFSATYPPGIEQLAAQFMREAHTVKTPKPEAGPRIAQRFYTIEPTQRLTMVARMLMHFRPTSTIAFCNTKQRCDALVALLRAQGISALALHGDLEQRERDQVLVQFAHRSLSVLVATDLAARGLDIQELQAVINVDIAPDPAVHVHRIGRTGRAGQSGLALSLATMDEMGAVGRIEQYQGIESQWYRTDELAAPSGAKLEPPMVTLQISGGRKDKIRAGDLLGALTADAGLTREQVGKITINDFTTYVAIDRDLALSAMAKLHAGKVKGRKVKARLL